MVPNIVSYFFRLVNLTLVYKIVNSLAFNPNDMNPEKM